MLPDDPTVREKVMAQARDAASKGLENSEASRTTFVRAASASLRIRDDELRASFVNLAQLIRKEPCDFAATGSMLGTVRGALVRYAADVEMANR